MDPGTDQAFIEYFEAHPYLQSAGRSGIGDVDDAIKKSTNIQVEPTIMENEAHPFLTDYFQQLHDCFQHYCTQWGILKDGFKDRFHIGSFNLQRYEAGGHFTAVHSERMGFNHIHRIFTWMTYLNDVPEGEETEFTFYGVKVQPVAGITFIWPVEWTHGHRG